MSDLKIFTEDYDIACSTQIDSIVNTPIFKNNKIRVMPDCHAGKGCCVGLTMEIKDKIIPDLTGVDLSCGVAYYPLGKNADLGLSNLSKFDDYLKNNIPSGRHVRNKVINPFYGLELLSFIPDKIERLQNSVGTLGGGNHFIAIEISEDGMPYLVVHTGSRNLGVQVNQHHQKIAEKGDKSLKKEVIDLYKENGMEHLINELNFPKRGTYLTGVEKENYENDCKVCGEYATTNRITIISVLLNFFGLDFDKSKYKETVHNYYDGKILRKGAVSAMKGEELIIPINMAKGSLICVGKGNEDWNCSAPHGAGRFLSRTASKRILHLEDMEKDMSCIYSSCVNENTLDEAPRAYKDFNESLVKDTVDVKARLTPIYNFKANE